MSGIAAAIGGGALLSAGSGMLGAASQNRAGRQARDYYADRTSEGQDRLWGALGGFQGLNARDGFRATDTADPTGASLVRQAGFNGGLLGGLRQNNRRSRKKGSQLAKRSSVLSGQNIKLFNDESAGLTDLSRGAEGIARGFGRGSEALIDQDAARSLKAANALGLGALNARGMGSSSLVGNQFSENALNVGREATRAKIGVRRDTTDRVLGARGQRINLADSRSGRRSALQTAGDERTLGIRGRNMERDLQLEDQYIKTILQAITGGVANPNLGQNTSAFYPGYSPSGSAIGTAGNSLSGIGGLLLARDLYPPQQGAPQAPARGPTQWPTG